MAFAANRETHDEPSDEEIVFSDSREKTKAFLRAFSPSLSGDSDHSGLLTNDDDDNNIHNDYDGGKDGYNDGASLDGGNGDDDPSSGPSALSRALNEIGTGSFQLFAALMLGLGNMADAVELTSIGFILPQLTDVTEAGKGVLSAGVFVGMLVGALFSGLLSDRWGRQPTLVVALAINATFGISSSFAPTWAWLVVFRILSGLGVGGSAGLVFTLLAEFLPVRRRGYYLTIVAWFWMFGSMYSAGSAWLMMGRLGISWRWYAFVAGLPAALGTMLTFNYIPESPRHLFVEGSYAEGVQVLRQIAQANGKSHVLDAYLPLFAQEARRAQQQRLHKHRHQHEQRSRLARFEQELREMFGSLMKLFEPDVRRSTIFLSMVWWSLSYGWYGLTLWIPTIMGKLDLGLNPYAMSFFVVVANLPGNAVSALIVDTIGRRKLLAGSMGAASLVAILFAASETIDSAWYTLPVAMAFNCLGTMGWNALDCISAELFPTETRNTGLGFATAFGRLGSLVSQIVNGLLIQHNLPIMLLVIAANILLGCISTLLLKESANEHLTDYANAHTTHIVEEDDPDVPVIY